VTSIAIGLASASDNFHLVEEFKGGVTDFPEFMTRLADVLEERGVIEAGELKRAANLAYNVHAMWDERRSAESAGISAFAAIGAAGFATALHVDALRALGRYQDVPHKKLPPAIHHILKRSGAHP